MSTHLSNDPAAVPATAPDPAWLELSAAFADEVPGIADRDDLMVTVAPGAGRGHPACFHHGHAHIEVNGDCLGGVDPATVKPWRTGDRARYASTWGALTHECAHARHTAWMPEPGTPVEADALEAARLLEESRIEAQHLRRRPDDQYWLRCCVADIVWPDLTAQDPAGPQMTEADAAQAAALVLAREDAGVLTRDETVPVSNEVRQILGDEKLDRLRAIWRQAHSVADDDTTAMLDLGRAWCDVAGPPPSTQPPTPGPGANGNSGPPDPAAATGGPGGSSPGSPGTPEPTGPQPSPSPEPGTPGGPGTTPEQTPLGKAVTDAFGNVARQIAVSPAPSDPTTQAEQAQAANEAAARASERAARKVFEKGGSSRARTNRHGDTAFAGNRPPSEAERRAATILARALDTAGIRDRVVTKTSSELPPGRLRMRGVLAREAQRAAGTIPTAQPFSQTTRTAVPVPPLRIGIACDVSGSMEAQAGPVASAAWILANAARHTRMETESATVIFGNHVRPITRPGQAPAHVTEFEAQDAYEAVDTAIDALDGALGLSQRGAARLLIIISDGKFKPPAEPQGQQRVDRLRAAGCAVLWLAPDPKGAFPLRGAVLHPLTDPAATARAIGKAATKALATAAS